MTVLDLTSCVVFSLVVTSGGYSLLGVHGLLIVVASPVAEHRLDGGGPRGDLLWGMWSRPRSGIEPVSPSMKGRFFFFFFFNHWAIREAPSRWLFKFFRIYFIYLFLAVLGLPCCAGSSLVVTSRGYSQVTGHGRLISVASLVAEHGLSGMRASVFAARGLSAWGSRALEHRLSSCGAWA